MAVSFFGDFDTTETVVIPFNTFDSNDPSASVTLTNLLNTDVHIHKDGGLVQRSSASGVAVDVDVDGITGCHWVTIDLSDNTDAGFYANGSQYSVRVEGITVDAATLNPWIGAFTIGRMLRPTIAGRTLDIQATGEVDANLTMIGGVAQSATDLKDFADAGYDPATNKVEGVKLVDTTTTNSDMRGTDAAALAVNYTAARAGYLDNINGHTAQTGDSFDRIGVAGAGLTNIDLPNQTMDITGNITGNLSGSVGSVTGAVGSVTGAVGSVTAGVTVTTNSDKTGYALSTAGLDAILQQQLTEGYNADGAAPTLEEALMGIYQRLTEFAIVGTTITVKKLDGSTTAMTLTMDDATDPTSSTRAT